MRERTRKTNLSKATKAVRPDSKHSAVRAAAFVRSASATMDVEPYSVSIETQPLQEHVPAYAAPLAEQAEAIVQQALHAGASDADVVIREGDEFDATVRMGELESLKDSGSRGVGLRVFLAGSEGARVGSTSSSDFTAAGLAHLVDGALALARISSPDPHQGLPETGAYGRYEADLALSHDDVYSRRHPRPPRAEQSHSSEIPALLAFLFRRPGTHLPQHAEPVFQVPGVRYAPITERMKLVQHDRNFLPRRLHAKERARVGRHDLRPHPAAPADAEQFVHCDVQIRKGLKEVLHLSLQTLRSWSLPGRERNILPSRAQHLVQQFGFLL